MSFIEKITRGILPIASPVQLCLIILACAAVTTVLLATLQRLEAALLRPPAQTAQAVSPAPDRTALLHIVDRPRRPRIEFEPTFADAAESLRVGRFAEAYGRFVTLADAGDADAGCIALVMHRYGPQVFGSMWDATTEQLAQWTRWSEAAAQRDLANRLGTP